MRPPVSVVSFLRIQFPVPSDLAPASLGDLASRVRFHTGGGIGSVADVRTLARWGAASAVIGRALLDGALTLEEARAAAR